MKKTRKVLVFSLALILALICLFKFMNIKVVLNADTKSPSKESSIRDNSYLKYIDNYTAFHNGSSGDLPIYPKLESSIVIGGESYNQSTSSNDFASDGFSKSIELVDVDNIYENSNSKSIGLSKVVLQREGRIDYNITVPSSGFYNIYLNYYTFKGYSSNIERKFMINGVVPFSDCENISFSRVWMDKEETKVQNGESFTYNEVNIEKDSFGNISYAKTWRKDTNSNDIKPQQVEVANSKASSYIKDAMGYINEPFAFYFDSSKPNVISFDYTKEPIIIDTIEIRSVEDALSYKDYKEALLNKHGEISISNSYARIEAEASSRKSSPTLYPITDRSDSVTTPFSITKSYLNSIGGTNWKVLGDWITWDFEVPNTGYYEISMRTKQNLIRGMFSTRRVSIATIDDNGDAREYKVLFDELNNLQISYNNKWKNVTLGNEEDGDYLFYFEKDVKYSLRLEVTLGDYASLIKRLQDVIDELSAMYRRIISYTTISPDANRDYLLKSRFPDLFYGLDESGNYTVNNKGQFNLLLDELNAISNTIKEISGGASDKTGVIDSVSVILQKFVDKPRTITKRLSTFSTNVSSLGSLLNDLREAPLNIDYIEIHSSDVKLPKANAGFFRRLLDGIASFFASFFIDYSSISETSESSSVGNTIEVWMTLGRDQANVVRNLIDTSFSSVDGYASKHSAHNKNINVNLKLTGADVLLKATLAGIGPDVALNVDSTLPVNYGLRNAVLDLTTYDDFFDNIYAIPDGSISYDESYSNVYMASSIRQFQFSSKDTLDEWFDSKKYTKEELQKNISGIYALPEKQIFLMMFVRDDIMEELGFSGRIPNTWYDMLDLVSSLQAEQLQFYLPVNDAGATALNPIFVSMLYQNHGSLYINNNMESGLKSEEAMRTFEFWTDLYTNYGFPTSASFVNRFRTGEMPLGIAYYELYNTLSVFAPELKGKWSFHLIPGTERIDEFGNTYIDHTATASGTGAVILKDAVSKSESKKNAAWTFLKWWTSETTQAQFGREMEGILGSAARHTTANVKALRQLAWPREDLDILLKQWSSVHEMPQIAGSYIVGREVENAFRQVINKSANAREVLFEYSQLIDTEINRKRSEFGLPLLND